MSGMAINSLLIIGMLPTKVGLTIAIRSGLIWKMPSAVNRGQALESFERKYLRACENSEPMKLDEFKDKYYAHGLKENELPGFSEIEEALRDFQRMAMVKADMDTAMRVFEAHMAHGESLSPEDRAALEIVYRSSSEETMGLVMEQMLATMRDARDNKTRVMAGLAIKELIAGGEPTNENLNALIVKLTK